MRAAETKVVGIEGPIELSHISNAVLNFFSRDSLSPSSKQLYLPGNSVRQPEQLSSWLRS